MEEPFLSKYELAKLVECLPNSKSCMCRWLKKNKWHFEESRSGFPKVARAYFEKRMSGLQLPDPESCGPDPEALLRRKRK